MEHVHAFVKPQRKAARGAKSLELPGSGIILNSAFRWQNAVLSDVVKKTGGSRRLGRKARLRAEKSHKTFGLNEGGRPAFRDAHLVARHEVFQGSLIGALLLALELSRAGAVGVIALPI